MQRKYHRTHVSESCQNLVNYLKSCRLKALQKMCRGNRPHIGIHRIKLNVGFYILLRLGMKAKVRSKTFAISAMECVETCHLVNGRQFDIITGHTHVPCAQLQMVSCHLICSAIVHCAGLMTSRRPAVSPLVCGRSVHRLPSAEKTICSPTAGGMAAVYCIYMGRSDVTESMVTIRSHFCGYETLSCVELNGEDLSCYSNKIESVSLSIWSPTYQQSVFKRCHSDKHFSEF